MNLDKAKKRIAKQVKKGFNGYPLISLVYFGKTHEVATDVVIRFKLDEGSEPQEQRLVSKMDARSDETIQSTIVKIIERANPSSVEEATEVSLLE